MSKRVSVSKKARPAARKLPPLFLDLDDTLLRTDLLHEGALTFVRFRPLRIFQLIYWLLSGKAVLKRRVSENVVLDVEHIPLNEQLVTFAKDYHDKGGRVGIATAADELLAHRIAARLDFVDIVVASDGRKNLKGAAKAEALHKRFPDGFLYAGDGPHDIPVWKKSAGVILSGASASTTRAAHKLGVPVVAEFPHEGMSPRRWLKALRVHQWAKNALVFVPLVLSGSVTNPALALNALLAFIAISLLASGTYLINDLFDLADDRKHWTKRERPLASGRLRIRQGIPVAGLLVVAGLAIAASVNLAVFATVAIYMAITFAYSTHLKRQPIVDAFTLAVLFTLRLGLGITAIGVWASPWLLVFSMFLFTSLSFAKRQTEIQRTIAAGRERVSGRGYRGTDKPLVLALGIAAGVAAINVMVLYLIEDAFSRALYGAPEFLWVFPAALFLWIGRVWLLCHREELNDDPVLFAVRDPISLALGATIAASFIAAWLL